MSIISFLKQLKKLRNTFPVMDERIKIIDHLKLLKRVKNLLYNHINLIFVNNVIRINKNDGYKRHNLAEKSAVLFFRSTHL